MKTVKLVSVLAERGGYEYSIVGTGTIHGEPISSGGDGRVIAHDLLEHVNGLDKIGSIDDELEAIGGCFYVRGLSGYLDIGGSNPHEGLASDVVYLAEIALENNIAFRNPVPKTKAGDCEIDFGEILNLARASCKYMQASDEDIDAFMQDALYFIRTGFRKANKKYKYMNQWEVNNLFWAITRKLNKYLVEPLCEGITYELKYQPGTVKLTCLTPEYEMY